MTDSFLTSLPSPWRGYLRALQGARKPIRAQMPAHVLRTAPLAPELERLTRYRQLCGLALAETLPPLWPQILAGPLHLQLVTRDDWPAPALGMVHLSNTWEQLAPIPNDAPLAITARPGPLVDSPAGLEVAIDTEVESEGQIVWRSRIVALHRVPKRRGKPSPPAPWTPPDRAPDVQRTFVAPEEIGRSYGRVAGDINPIHMHPLAARAFGFPRAIAHGTWTTARALAAVSALLPDPAEGPVRHSVRFVRPLFLPGRAVVEAWREGATTWWQVRSASKADTVHVRGEVTSGASL